MLVFILVMASIANHRHGQETHIRPILWLYLLGTFGAAVVAVVASMLFPSNLVLSTGEATLSAPGGITEVLQNLLLSAVDNPVNALLSANFIGVLTWAIGLGVALRHAGETTRSVVEDLSNGVTLIVRVVIRFAPLGIFGLVSATLAQSGLNALLGYLHLLAVLIGCMLFVALVMNPLIVFWKIRRNPYPLTLLCLRESGITAFSPAARRPIFRSTWRCRSALACTKTLTRCPFRWGHHQHGRCRNHHYRADPGCGAHPGYSGGPADGSAAKRGGRHLCLRRLGCGRRLATVDSAGVQPVWYP